MDNLQNISVLAHELSDLELALLICLGGREHCLIEATEGNIHDVAAELALICSHTYGLRYAVVEFSGTTSLEDFHDQVCTHSRSEPGTVADVVIAKNFDYASERIQLEAVELMRSRKLTTSSGVREAPTHFLFVPVIVHDLSQVRPKLNVHLVSLLWQLVMLSNAPRTTLSSYPTFTTLKAALRSTPRREQNGYYNRRACSVPTRHCGLSPPEPRCRRRYICAIQHSVRKTSKTARCYSRH
ncbi:uncharacterized protein ANIA_06910 [Aspergillus nidulans FGSC A4]|uniref:Uncharacterized protein n=1 Tax=Emericella nidulans (strain FGSC A4 / ATCC 38163 / CBS 112.46 / NRRL 194 / M139) TaxID=227321 RepID=C8V2Y9_EMENI|nr:hypothetical protein [Aspergillus nidulans FGSC A4]CBF71714.1 TPA: hypothetical protein ANIA_06910 [Aspergillus nidulans FGSC A4]